MVICPRINRDCPNRCSTIMDTNALIHYMQYLSETKYSRENYPSEQEFRRRHYHDILNDFRNVFSGIKADCSFGRFFASNLGIDEEYKGTFLYEVRFLNNLGASYQRNFLDILLNGINSHNVDRDALRDLKIKADNFTRNPNRRLSEIDYRDLSFLLGALEEINLHRNYKYLIVTGDDSFRKFVAHVKAQRRISLAGQVYLTRNVNGIMLLTHLTHLYKCCHYDDLREFRRFMLKKEIEGKPKRVKIRKRIKYEDWIFDVFEPAITEKTSLGVC